MCDSVSLGWSLRICIPIKVQGAAGGLRTTPYTTCMSPLPRRTRKEARTDGRTAPLQPCPRTSSLLAGLGQKLSRRRPPGPNTQVLLVPPLSLPPPIRLEFKPCPVLPPDLPAKFLTKLSQATAAHNHLSPPRRPPAFIIKTTLFSA